MITLAIVAGGILSVAAVIYLVVVRAFLRELSHHL